MLYFDHNSTTPVDSRVADLMDRAQRDLFGNASSIHRAGQNARQALEQARRGIARRLGAQGSEIVFTSGGTEANNLTIRGLPTPGSHAVTSVIEHPSVLEPFRQLEREGVAVTYVPVNENGVVEEAAVARAIRPETVLVSLMAANNETGAIQPFKEVAALVRARRNLGQPIWFHSDGVQAAGKFLVGLSNVDLFSISGHKMYAPKGLGLLFVRQGVPLRPIHLGGRQERALRAGTENVPGALALEKAFDLCSETERDRMAELRDDFEHRILRAVPGARVNAAAASRLANTSNILFPGVSGEALLIALDMRGMCVSTGAACSSGSLEPSPVLLKMGLSAEEARGCIRFSFGRGNAMQEMEELAQAVSLACVRMREKQHV